MKGIVYLIIIAVGFVLSGCISSNDRVLGVRESQVKVRNYQSRSFDTGDKEFVMRSIISTMQDLGFIIERADEKLGTISGTSFENYSKLTVTVRSVSNTQTIVRANAQSGLMAIDEPLAYQNFFIALSQSMFLDANTVE
jgi:hypothetical protein